MSRPVAVSPLSTSATSPLNENPTHEYPLIPLGPTCGDIHSSDSSTEDGSPRGDDSTDTESVISAEPHEEDHDDVTNREEDEISRLGDESMVETDTDSDTDQGEADLFAKTRPTSSSAAERSGGPDPTRRLLDSSQHIVAGLDPLAQQNLSMVMEKVDKMHGHFQRSTNFIATFSVIITVFGWFPILILLYVMAALGIGANAPALGVAFAALTGTVLYGINGFKNRHRYVFGEWRGVWWGWSFIALLIEIGAAIAAGFWEFQFCSSTDPANNVRSIQVACEDNPGYLLGIFIVILIVIAAQFCIFVTQCVIGWYAWQYEKLYTLHIKDKGHAFTTAFKRYIHYRNVMLNKGNEGGFGLSSFYYSDPYPKSDV